MRSKLSIAGVINQLTNGKRSLSSISMGDNPRHYTQSSQPEDLPFDGQPPSLVIVEQESLLADDLAQHLVLGSEILHRLLLTPVDLSGNSDQPELPGMQHRRHSVVFFEQRTRLRTRPNFSFHQPEKAKSR